VCVVRRVEHGDKAVPQSAGEGLTGMERRRAKWKGNETA